MRMNKYRSQDMTLNLNIVYFVIFTFIQKILNIYLVIFVAFLVKIYIFFYFCCQKCPFQFFKPLKNIFLLRNGCKLQSKFPNNFGWSPNSFDIFWKEAFFPHHPIQTKNVPQRLLVTKGFQCGAFWWPKVSKLQCLGD